MTKKTATKITFTFEKGTDRTERRMIAAFFRRLANYEQKKADAAQPKPCPICGRVDDNHMLDKKHSTPIQELGD